MKQREQFTFLKQFICVVLSIIIITPFYMVLINSFKTKGEAARMSVAFPTEWVFGNYIEVINRGHLLIGFFNSMLYAVVSTTVGVLLSAMAVFVISRNRTKLNNFIYYFILCGLFIPVNYVTLSAVLQFLNLSGTRMGIIITFTSSMIPFCVFTLRNFFSTIPVELDEAAIVDGATPLRLFFTIIVPLLKPALVTAFILQFMGIWSDFITPLYLADTSAQWPMNLAVYNFFGKNGSYWNYVFADIVLTCLPVIIIYLIGQRYIVGGLTSGAVKE